MNNRKIHFVGLNSLRFFAAYFVIFHHGETIRAKNGLFNLEQYSFFRNGSIAVSFFFVLSGFLITYLLLAEKKRTNDINLKNFYMRRVYRIFPLYYLLVFIGLAAIPVFLHLINFNYLMPYDTLSASVLFLFFLSFVVNPLYGSHLLEPLWSIGVEEYFYLMWAPLFKFFTKKGDVMHHKSLIIIFSVIGIKTAIMLFFYFYSIGNSTFHLVKEVLLNLKFELMAIGGLGAVWFFYNSRTPLKVWFFNKYSQILFYILIIIRLFFFNYFTESPNFIFKFLFQTPLLSVYTEGGLFLWLILNTSINSKPIIKLHHPILEKLGEISYGIYMYQMLIIFGTILFFKKMMFNMNPLLQTVFFYSVVTVGVLGVSWLSKKYFEDYFLKFKKG